MEPTVDFNTAVATDQLGLAKSLIEKWQMTVNKLKFNNKKSLPKKENEIRYSPFPQREPIEETHR